MSNNSADNSSQESLDEHSLNSELQFDSDLSIPAIQEELNNSVESALETLLAALRREFSLVRKRELKSMQDTFRQQMKRLEFEANRQLKQKLSDARTRDRAKIEEREQRLHEMVKKLNILAREIAQQKLQLKKSRREFEQKLMESDFIQSELRNIGKQMGDQVDSLGDSLLDEDFSEDADMKIAG